jgi:hypothetical protein
MSGTLTGGRTYANAYMLFIDASGHSTVVRDNPQDVAADGLRLLEQRISERIATVSQRKRCTIGEPWSWQGDGGFFIFHDNDESVALSATLESGLAILQLDLPHLQQEFQLLSIEGDLHLRVSAHKGVLVYDGGSHRGSIHSADLNFGAHLEKETPRDHFAVSEDVIRVAGVYREKFTEVGMFESRRVFLYSPSGTSRSVQRAWLTGHGLEESPRRLLALHQRPSAFDKARLIGSGEDEIIDMGTALNTCSNYLVTTERPTPFKDAVIEFLARGGFYRCYMLDLDSPEIPRIAKQFHEDTAGLLARSIRRFETFKGLYPEVAHQFEVYTMAEYPGFAAMGVDLHRPDGLLLMSPYLRPLSGSVLDVSRADFTHFVRGNLTDPLSRGLVSLVESYRAPANIRRIL